MKKGFIFLLIGLLIGGGGVFYYLKYYAPGQNKVAGTGQYAAVTSHLDSGGNFYFYMNTANIMTFLEDLGEKIEKIIKSDESQKPEEKQKNLNIFNQVRRFVIDYGLLDIKGVGASSIPIDKGLHQSKFHVYHKSGKGLAWRLMEKDPKDLHLIKWVPADAIMANGGEFKISELWQWIQVKAKESNIEEMQKGVLSLEPMLKAQGIDLNKLLQSLNGKMGFIVTADTQETVTLPIGKTPTEIPSPALAIVFSVNDDYIFSLLHEKFPFLPMTEKDGIKKLQIPFPGELPIQLQLQIILKDNMLILASDDHIVDSMLSAKEKGDGLTATPEFKELSARMPVTGNGFRFLSTRFSKLLQTLQKKGIETAGGKEGNVEMQLQLMEAFQWDLAHYLVVQNLEDGLLVTVNHKIGFETVAMVPAFFVLGIGSAIAIPNILKAKEKGKLNLTMGNMKSIATALGSYTVDKNQVPPGNTLEEIQKELSPFYIKVLPLKDGWGNDILYVGGGAESTDYSLASAGADGVFMGWQQTDPTQSDDIIMKSGYFVISPVKR